VQASGPTELFSPSELYVHNGKEMIAAATAQLVDRIKGEAAKQEKLLKSFKTSGKQSRILTIYE
jgi:hypothetical protein